jgi:UDP-N-acetylglucosamine 1-carboxyvinyltransferase
MEKFVINGGRKLNGVITVSGNKNEALPALAAAVLTDDPVLLRNLPRNGDVLTLIGLLRSAGSEIERIGPNDYKICCKGIDCERLDDQQCSSLRAAILLAGPFITRFKSFYLHPPGGDVIGRRRLDAHFSAFKSLGVSVKEKDRKYFFQRQALSGCQIFLEEQSVTATENIMMAASLARGTTFLTNCACEPHVAGLGRMLESMGASLSGMGTHKIKVTGVEKLSGTEHVISPDYLEVCGYIVLAAITDSELTIRNVNSEDLVVAYSAFKKLGIKFEIDGNEVFVPGNQKIVITEDFSGDVAKIDDGPWPAFPSDLMSLMIVAATQAKGTLLFFEKMYDGRMFFIDYLIAMGAKIILCDPHRAVVVGPAKLYGSDLRSPDIRAGMALILAALCADGESTIHNIGQIDRGYENLQQKLNNIGADIKRVRE